jgi:hypothetical protein
VQNIPMDKFDYRYAEGKWNIKEIIQHVIDTERIFGVKTSIPLMIYESK